MFFLKTHLACQQSRIVMKTIMSQKWHSGRISTLRTLLLLPILLAGAVLNTVAQSPPASPDSSLRDILNQLPGTSLGLEDAIRSSMTSDPAVLSAGAMVAAAHGVMRREGGAFEPQLFLAGCTEMTSCPRHHSSPAHPFSTRCRRKEMRGSHGTCPSAQASLPRSMQSG